MWQVANGQESGSVFTQHDGKMEGLQPLNVFFCWAFLLRKSAADDPWSNSDCLQHQRRVHFRHHRHVAADLDLTYVFWVSIPAHDVRHAFAQ